jgi:agmatine/peptidylarginine deiminase
MSRVEFIIKTTDSIWMRDYGPRYIYKGVNADGTGGVRAIVDHTYNRPRPNDNTVPANFAGLKSQDRHLIPLVHGGGNYHLESGTGTPEGVGHSTRLITNENPGLSEAQIIQHWRDYQNLETVLYTPYPSFVDSTQHIDMWMVLLDDDKVMISEWVNEPTASWAVTSDNAAAYFAGRGFDVIRVPAVRSGGTHYTFTNVVICNDLVLVPSYTNSTAAAHNATALAAWQAAYPDKTISQINCQSLVTSAGVMHCIVMHVPENYNGESPTVWTSVYNDSVTLDPGDLELITWMVDDDEGATTVDILLSTDGGASFPTTIASGVNASTGGYAWTVPDIGTSDGRIRVVASDADSNTGFDDNDAAITITGAAECLVDFTGDGSLDIFDVFAFLDAFNAGDLVADFTGDGTLDIFDVFAYLDGFNAGCP